MNEEWSNDACRGYVIKAMENCGFHAKDIHQVLVELYESLTSALLRRRRTTTKIGNTDSGQVGRGVEKNERTALFAGCCPFAFPHWDNAGNAGSQPTTQRRLQWYNPLLIRVKPKPSIFRGKALCWKVLRRYSLRRKRKSEKRRLNAVFMRCSASTEGPAIPRPDHRQHCPRGYQWYNILVGW